MEPPTSFPRSRRQSSFLSPPTCSFSPRSLGILQSLNSTWCEITIPLISLSDRQTPKKTRSMKSNLNFKGIAIFSWRKTIGGQDVLESRNKQSTVEDCQLFWIFPVSVCCCLSRPLSWIFSDVYGQLIASKLSGNVSIDIEQYPVNFSREFPRGCRVLLDSVHVPGPSETWTMINPLMSVEISDLAFIHLGCAALYCLSANSLNSS